MIAFIGSVFSPYYARAITRRQGQAEHFCAMNVVLYQPRRHAWAMTERRRHSVVRDSAHLQIGPSRLHWDGAALHGVFDEITVPVPRRLKGRICVRPQALERAIYPLDEGGRHGWQPIAPRARIEVDFGPDCQWQGHAYIDSNHGSRPMGLDFSSWHWSRGMSASGARVLYDVQPRDGERYCLALRFSSDRPVERFAAPPIADLPRGLWRVKRETRSDSAFRPMIVKTLEDSPFYMRSLIRTQLEGESQEAVHESLDLNRFDQPWVRLLLPFRMPRHWR